MSYIDVLFDRESACGMKLRHMQPQDVQLLEALQKIIFPTLSEEELILAKHYLNHLELFPEGQFVVTDLDKVVAMTSTMRCYADFATQPHRFKDAISGGWMLNHQPAGDWLYGLDIGVHPDYRGIGLGRGLYRARHEMATALGLKGQYTVGMMTGYGMERDKISGEEYYHELVAGKRIDPTVSMQMKIGFEPIALMPGYVTDPRCGDFGVLMKLDINKKI